MRFSEYINYFKAAAISNKAIGHTDDTKRFRSITIDELLNDQKSNLVDTAMYVLPPQILTQDGGSDNPRKIFVGEVLILKMANPRNNQSIADILDDTEAIAEQIIAKMKNDRVAHLHNKNYQWKLKDLDIPSIRMTVNGPLMGSWHGWGIEFKINQLWPNRMTLNNEDWLNDTLFTP